MAKIFGIVVVIVGCFLVFVALKPSEYLVYREVKIKAAPEKIFPYLASAKKSNEWMPWAEMEPGLQMNFSGPEDGVGSTASWDSTGRMGHGKSEVVGVVPNQTVDIKLTYTKPMQMEQMAQFAATPAGEFTTVRWTVSGKNNFIGKVMCSFMNMDKMVGGSFEKGLAKLKALIEAAP